MTMRTACKKITICEVLRILNDRLQDEKFSEERDLLALAEKMAKKMSAKMLENSLEKDSLFWKQNNQYLETFFKRLNKNYVIGNADRAERKICND